MNQQVIDDACRLPTERKLNYEVHCMKYTLAAFARLNAAPNGAAS